MAAAQNKNSYCLLCLRSEKLRTLRTSKCMERLVGMLNLAMSTTWKRRHKDNKLFCFVCEALLSRTLQVLELLKYSMKANSVIDSNNTNSEYPAVHKMTSLLITETLYVTCGPEMTLPIEEFVSPSVGGGGRESGGTGRDSSLCVDQRSDVVIIDGDVTYIIDDDDDDAEAINVKRKDEVTKNTSKLQKKKYRPIKPKPPPIETSKNTHPTADNANAHINAPVYASKPNQANTLHSIMPSADQLHFINAPNINIPQLFPLPSQFAVNSGNIILNTDRPNILSQTNPPMCLNIPMSNNNKKMVAVETTDNKFMLHELIEGNDGVLYAPSVPGRIVNDQLEFLEAIKFVNNSIIVETKSPTKEVDNAHRNQLSMVNENNINNAHRKQLSMANENSTINKVSPNRMNSKRAKIVASFDCDFEMTPSSGAGGNLNQNVVSAPSCGGMSKRNGVSDRTGARNIAANSQTPRMKDGNIDWEDKIPMDVITYMDATDPTNPLNVEKPQSQLGVISAVYSETDTSDETLQLILNDVNSTLEDILSKENGVATVISIED